MRQVRAIKGWPAILSCVTAEEVDKLILLVKSRMFASPEPARGTQELFPENSGQEFARPDGGEPAAAVRAPKFRTRPTEAPIKWNLVRS